jgi:hypothetical protein
VRTPLTTTPQLVDGYANYLAAMQMANGLEPFEPSYPPMLECLKSLDDLDEEADEDGDEDLEDEDEDDDLDEDEDEEVDDDFDEDDDDEDDDEDEDEEEDEDGGVKPLKMSPYPLV